MNTNTPRFHSMRALASGIANCLGTLMTPPGPRPPPTPGKVTALPPSHSTMFDIGRELLMDGHDISSAVVRLRERYPALSAGQAESMLREVACLLHCAGERHVPEVA